MADLLMQLGIAYDSEDAVNLAESLMGFIQEESRAASKELKEQRSLSQLEGKQARGRGPQG